MNIEDIFTHGGGFPIQYSEEMGASVKAFERITRGLAKTEKELRALRRDPKSYADYRLQYEVFQEPPFDRLRDISPGQIYHSLKDLPHLETYNTKVLVAAFLYRQRYPTGNIEESKLNSFFKFLHLGQKTGEGKQEFINKVDLIRYIMIYDRERKNEK